MRNRNRIFQHPLPSGGSSFPVAPPTNGDWAAAADDMLVDVQSGSPGPGGSVAAVLFRLRRASAPTVPIETITTEIFGFGVSDTSFTPGTTVIVVAAWATALGVQLSDWSDPQNVDFL